MDLLSVAMFLLVFMIILLSSLIIYARWNYGTLEAMGIPVVKPHWLLGSNYNYMELYHQWEDWKRAKELGLTYGVYNGRTPEVYTADPEIIRRMLLTDSDHFANKRKQDFGSSFFNEMLELVNGDKWKLQRSILSPLFSSLKIKRNMEIVHKISDDHIKVLHENVNANGGRYKINFHEYLPPFAIEIIAESLCGIKLNDVYSPDNSFVTTMKGFLWSDLDFTWTFNWLQVFPFMSKLIPQFDSALNHLGFFIDLMKDILDQREASGEKVQDTVGALLEIRQSSKTEEFKKAGITFMSTYSQAFEFFVASYIGILTAIEHTCYHLAKNPAAKKKAVEEVDKIFAKYDGVIGNEALAELPYLSAAIQESFRISTTFFRVDRCCTKDWDSGTGFHIKKGTAILFPAYAVHHNPDNYPQPDQYKPERFLPENKDMLVPYTYLPFGLGHRQCMGSKFVMEMLKSFMVRLLRDFDVQERQDTEWKEFPGMHLYLKLAPIYLDLVSRN